MSYKTKNEDLSVTSSGARVAGRIADIQRFAPFATVCDNYDSDESAESADYVDHRKNVGTHLARIARVIEFAKTPDQRDDQIWDVQRDAALTVLGDTDIAPAQLGHFAKWLMAFEAGHGPVEVPPRESEAVILTAGDRAVVRTNERIKDLHKENEFPLDFLHGAAAHLAVLSEKERHNELGPENFATSLKFFADKIMTPGYALEEDEIDEARLDTNELVAGFLKSLETDEPNVIELTNVYVSIRCLPDKMIDRTHTEGLLKMSLEHMDEFDDRALGHFVGAMSRLDLTDVGEAAAMALDLAFRKGSKNDRTKDLLVSLRAIANLPKTPAAEQAFTTLMDIRSSVVVAADIKQLRNTNSLLLKIVNKVVENPDETLRAKSVAEVAADRASRILEAKRNSTSEVLPSYKEKQLAVLVRQAHDLARQI